MKTKIKCSGKTWISLSLMAIGVFIAVEAREWPFRSALFPVVIGSAIFFMALTELLLGLFGRGEGKGKSGALGTKLVDEGIELEPAVFFRRTVMIFSWILGFFLMIMLLGFTFAVPLLVFLYLKLQSREGWGLTLSLTAATIIFYYGLFVWLLETPFPLGWIFRWLDAIGLLQL